LDDAQKRTVAFGYDKDDTRGIPRPPQNGNATDRTDQGTASTSNGGLRAAEHRSGALAIGDATLLAFPVASLAGVFGWVTCPAAIRALQRVWSILPNVPEPATGESAPFDPRRWTPPKELKDEQAYWADDTNLGIRGSGQGSRPEEIVLREAVLRRPSISSANDSSSDEEVERIKAAKQGIEDLGQFAGWLATHVLAGQSDEIQEKLRKDLVLVHDDTFGNLVESGIHVITRVKIDDDSGAVGQGPWDEELLPAETILFAPIFAGGSRVADPFEPGKPRPLPTANEVMNYFIHEVVGNGAGPRIFQIGAGATVGWGFMAPATTDGSVANGVKKEDNA
jgi:CRISPR-associated protein Cmr4